jgi:hypothetical protein
MTVMTSRPLPVQAVSTYPANEEQHFLLSDVAWPSYLAIGQALADRAGLRLTYDRGNLEFMTTSRLHERYKKWLNRFIEQRADKSLSDRSGKDLRRHPSVAIFDIF